MSLRLSSLYEREISSAGPMLEHAPAVQEHGAVAEALDAGHVMRHEDDRAALGLQALELAEALLLEGGIADGEHLVHQQDVGLDLHRDRERQPHRHPRRVVAQVEVHELLELGERDDLVEALPGLPCARGRA